MGLEFEGFSVWIATSQGTTLIPHIKLVYYFALLSRSNFPAAHLVIGYVWSLHVMRLAV